MKRQIGALISCNHVVGSQDIQSKADGSKKYIKENYVRSFNE